MKGHNKGVLLSSGPEAHQNTERQTFTCGHCGNIGLVNAPKAEFGEPLDVGFAKESVAGRMCHTCANIVCQRKDCNVLCVPFVRKVEEQTQADYRRQQNAMVRGV